MSRVFVAGVGMTPFLKPAPHNDYPAMAREAGTAALRDAGITYDEVQQVVAGYVFGDSCSGQRAAATLGLSGVPIVNVNNNCASGSTALFLGRQLVESGLADVVLALGFEKMRRGSLSATWNDRANPVEPHVASVLDGREPSEGPLAPQLYAAAAQEHMVRFGSTPRHFAMVGEKNHRHSQHNPHAQFRDVYSLEDIEASPVVSAPLTKLQCSPTSDGAAAVVLMSERAIARTATRRDAVEVLAQAMTSDMPDTFDPPSAIGGIGTATTRRAADQVWEKAGLGPYEVQVLEVHDCFSPNELLTYEALGLAAEGEGHLLLEKGDVTYGGRWVVNPSGGLISKGHPLGATGLAQCAELTWQLRGTAGARQVDQARFAVQHNMGLGTATVVTLYGRS
jgi:acetyl-CoA acyltransferase